jgi:hypothetical protein
MPRPNRESKNKAPAKPSAVAPRPQRNGGVGVCVEPAEHGGIGVIRITTKGQDGKEVSRYYLLQTLGLHKVALTKFKSYGGGTYVVSLKPGVRFCGCEDWKNRRTDCKHILAVESLHRENKL